MASLVYSLELAQLFREKHIIFLSQDDKARDPIGFPVSRKRYMLMHLLDKVSFLHRHFPRGEILSV